MREQFANNATTTLDGAIDNSQTSIDVVDGSVFPSTGNFRLIVDSEYMLCTARNTNTLTVVRGIEGSTPAAHIAGTAVSHILTAGGLMSAVSDNSLWVTGPPYGNISLSDFTVINGTGVTATEHSGRLSVVKPGHSGESVTLFVVGMPTPPFTLEMACRFFGYSPEPYIGPVAYNSSTNRFVISAVEYRGGVQQLVTWRYASPTTFSGTVRNRAQFFGPQPFWLQMVHDGTNLEFNTGCDGENWLPWSSEVDASYVSADSIGFGVANLNASNDAFFNIFSFVVY